MKIRIIPAVIATAISALIAYGFYSFCQYVDLQLLVTIFGGISIFLTLATSMAVSVTNSRISANVKVVSGICTLLLLISNIVFCCITTFPMPLYIIVNGLLLLAWIVGVYTIVKAKQ